MTPAELLASVAAAARSAGVVRAKVTVGDLSCELELGLLPAEIEEATGTPAAPSGVAPDPLERLAAELDRRRGGQ